MKIIISEEQALQLELLLTEGRLETLSKTYDMFTPDDVDELKKNRGTVILTGPSIGYIAAIKPNKKGTKPLIRLSKETFDKIVDIDPTKNLQYIQWMIERFVKLLREGFKAKDYDAAVRFMNEDIDLLNEYLLFS